MGRPRTPVAVEVPFATSVAGVVIRGRMDAVFADRRRSLRRGRLEDRPPADRPRPPRTPPIQLGAYRLAWAELAGVPVTRVRAGFHYVRDGVTVRPADLIDAAGLIALVGTLPERPGTADGAMGRARRGSMVNTGA